MRPFDLDIVQLCVEYVRLMRPRMRVARVGSGVFRRDKGGPGSHGKLASPEGQLFRRTRNIFPHLSDIMQPSGISNTYPALGDTLICSPSMSERAPKHQRYL